MRQMAVGQLVPYERNARVHPKKQIDKIVESIRRYGFTAPVLIWQGGMVLAGHGRLEAAKQMGLRRVPTIDLSHLSEAQAREYILADNRLAELAIWDEAILRVEIRDLQAMSADLTMTGFSPAALAKYMPGRAEKGGLELAAEAAPVSEPEAAAVSLPGDLWLLGPHRLLCGDATRAADVARLGAGGLKPGLMVTDPPYGVSYDPAWRDEKALPGSSPLVMTGKVIGDHRCDWSAAWRLFKGDVAYVWHGGTKAARVADSIEAAGFAIRAQIVWVKQHHVISRGAYHWKHEPCWYAVRDGQSAGWKGSHDQTTVWEIANANTFDPNKAGQEDARTHHGTQKPVEYMARPILNHTDAGEAVYDPFVGSGTTIIAAEQLGRACYAIEIGPAYVDVAVKRWQNLTGKPALLDGDGRDFDALAAARRAPAAAE